MIHRTFALGTLAVALLAGAAFAAAPPVPKQGTDHGLRIFYDLDSAADFTMDGKPVGHVDPATDVSLGVTLGKHTIALKNKDGDEASADLTLDDTDDVVWHGNKFWCLRVRYTNDKDIEFVLAQPKSCETMLTEIDTARAPKP
jgi:hypothetical protein